MLVAFSLVVRGKWCKIQYIHPNAPAGALAMSLDRLAMGDGEGSGPLSAALTNAASGPKKQGRMRAQTDMPGSVAGLASLSGLSDSIAEAEEEQDTPAPDF